MTWWAGIVKGLMGSGAASGAMGGGGGGAASGAMGGGGGSSGGGPKSKQNMDQWTQEGFRLRSEALSSDLSMGSVDKMNQWTTGIQDRAEAWRDEKLDDMGLDSEALFDAQKENEARQTQLGILSQKGRPSGQQYRNYGDRIHDYTTPPSEVLLNNLGGMGNPWTGGSYRNPESNISPWLSGRGMYG